MNDELVYGTEPTFRGGVVGWALVVALGVGIAWGLASIWTGWRLAWAAPLAALVIAYAWREAAAVRTQRTALGAAALLLLSTISAWGCATLVGRQHVSSRELTNEPGLVTNAVRDWMFAEGQIIDPLAATHDDGDQTTGDEESDDRPIEDEADASSGLADGSPPLRPEAQVRKRLANMDDAEKKRIVAWYVNQPGGQAARREATQRAWRWTDLVWVAAGAWLAFRLNGPGRSGDDDWDDDDEDA
ncbi:MAG: hypothetical protein AAF916_07225 [Planctomycetota bacterium]